MVPVMKVVITGSTGLIGSALVPLLEGRGDRVTRLRRGSPPGAGQAWWDPGSGLLSPDAFDGAGAVVHLAGENIASGRWTSARKSRIRDSRVLGTRLLCETLATLDNPPPVLVSSSAIGYYGDRSAQMLDESALPGSGFLAEVCQAWEAAVEPARKCGIRVVVLRTGIVLSTAGGALARMLTPFVLGVGGIIGSGRQYMSWITLDDLLASILHCLTDGLLSGPVNGVAPNAATNQEFTKTLGRVLRRPTCLPIPALATRLAFGEMADALLLVSTRVGPARLIASGFGFRYPTLEGALRHVLGRPTSSLVA